MQIVETIRQKVVRKGEPGVKRDYILAALASLFCSLVFIYKSNLHPWRAEDASTDSSVFKTVVMMMEKGYMPYRDSFDHKGPLIYIINYLGNRISYYRGILVIEIICLTLTFFLIYTIARLSCKPFISEIITLVSTSLLFTYFEHGNYCQEYAMPFIALSIFVFLDYLINKKVSMLRVFVSGFSCAVILLLQPNMAAVWVVFCFAILVLLIRSGEYDSVFRFSLEFILGMAVLFVPIMVWLAVNGAIPSLWQDYIVFNHQYTSVLPLKMFEALVFYLNNPLVIAVILCMVYYCKKGEIHRNVNVLYLLFLILSIALLTIAGVKAPHYAMTIVPAVAYPLSLMVSDIETIADHKTAKQIILLLTVFLMSVLVIPAWFNLIIDIPETIEDKNDGKDHSEHSLNELVALVLENTDENDAISVYGNWDLVYVKSQRKHATKYSYQFPIGEVMPDIMDEYWAQLKEELPPIIVVAAKHHDDNINRFLEENDYSLLWAEEEEYDESYSSIYTRNR